MSNTIAIIDLGGQYCHLISRRLRDLGVWSEIFDSSVSPSSLQSYAGIILSGGPRSVNDVTSPTVDHKVFKLHKPVLGICYGHQLLAKHLGATVAHSDSEFGPAKLSLVKSDSLFHETPAKQIVWMSHSDSVIKLPRKLTVLAKTAKCENAAFADFKNKLFGVQFHPEVVHSKYGAKMLRNFAFRVCGIREKDTNQDQISRLVEAIRVKVQDNSVFFLVSGGVDSTVAFALCAKALPKDRILGVYVDTGLMRKNETGELRSVLESLDLKERLKIRDESARFLSALEGKSDPEEKRRIIGRLFVEVQKEAMREYGISEDKWLLGQGTIYPDTIESGGSRGTAAVIKTHHNRCEEIQHLLEQGRVVEPLVDFYKDEVRRIGLDLGLSPKLMQRWPFPGPGLAIRCICSDLSRNESVTLISLPKAYSDFEAVRLNIRSVGVQGDERTFRHVVALSGPLEYDRIQDLSSDLCNSDVAYNRVIYLIAGAMKLSNSFTKPASLNANRIELLREADFVARSVMEERELVNTVWQFPVVLIPLSSEGGESIVLRPVNSEDGMTANFARLRKELLVEIGTRISMLGGVDAVFLDVTDKPPATIEWE